MPKHNRCYYGYCDSDNRVDPSIAFYRFPKDPDRCRMWVRSCNNPELTEIWEKNPDRLTKIGICQNHFLPQFLGSSSRLVGHAIPTPMMEVDHDEFMTTCAGLKAYPSSSSTSKTIVTENVATAEAELDSLFNRIESFKNSVDEAIVITHPLTMHSYKATPSGPGPQVIVINTCPGTQSAALQAQNNFSVKIVQQDDEVASLNGKFRRKFKTKSRIGTESSSHSMDTDSRLVAVSNNQSEFELPSEPTNTSSVEYKMVIPVAPGSNSLVPAHDKAAEECPAHKNQIEVYKQKIRFYQRKLAVTNHRYQKLRGQLGGRSKKLRLIESLKACKADFDPCLYEILLRQFQGKAKHGNRWPDDVKSFCSSLYLRSKINYRQIRKKIDLPSDSVLKRFITETKLDQNPETLTDDELTEEEEESEQTVSKQELQDSRLDSSRHSLSESNLEETTNSDNNPDILSAVTMERLAHTSNLMDAT